MTARCVALLSGGLDSMLAIRIMQQQGVEVEALNFKTIFTCCQDQSAQAAHNLGVRLTVVGQDDDYLDLVKAPRFGYGKGANPCVDCRIYMFQKARQFMQQVGAQFIVSGEVVGQRPMSQKRSDLDVISHHSDLEDLLLRPLSAKLLPLTLPERQGLVDRDKLYGFWGRSRKGLMALARQFGFQDIPTPSTGCALTETRFSGKVHDLVRLEPESGRWDFELLKTARHFRFDAQTKVLVGRDESDNETLRYMHHLPEARSTALLEPDNFPGPVVLLIGPETEAALSYAVGMVTRYSKSADFPEAQIRVQTRQRTYLTEPQPHPQAEQANTLATV
jgi:tRNA-specific 2-thiouridylase